jgi:methylated-DNA-[protein]-cysteine S-methyltransferase
MLLIIDRLSSPIGTLLLVSDDDGRVRALDFNDYEARMLRLLKTHYGDPTLAPGQASVPARRALDAYFAGDLTAIDDVRVATGGTPFQRTVWAALRRIPAGTTTSYGVLAATIGHPSAMRAVGLAVGSNPVAVIVPCHRVIGADHSLTGYAGGLPRKRWLLEHEGLELSGGRLAVQHQLRFATLPGGEARCWRGARLTGHPIGDDVVEPDQVRPKSGTHTCTVLARRG